MCSARNSRQRCFIVSINNRFGIFFFCLVTFFLVVNRETSRKKNDVTDDLSLAPPYVSSFHSGNFLFFSISFLKIKYLFCQSLYFFKILPVTSCNYLFVTLPLDFAYLAHTFSTTAVWNNIIFFRDVAERCLTSLFPFDLGEELLFVNMSLYPLSVLLNLLFGFLHLVLQ